MCGACTVRVDGAIVRGCLMLAVQCDGAEVETIEGVSDPATIADLQDAFRRRNALQCGFCTPGMLLDARRSCSHAAACPSRDTIREQFPATTAAAPAIRLSSMQSNPSRQTRAGKEAEP